MNVSKFFQDAISVPNRSPQDCMELERSLFDWAPAHAKQGIQGTGHLTLLKQQLALCEHALESFAPPLLQTELPTGSGFYILQPGVTFLFPSDPVVLFGSISYIWNIPRNEGGQIGRVDPGSGANANLGLGISLNEKVSLSLGYDHTVFERPTSSSNLLLTTTPSVTQIGVLLIGGAYRLSDRSFVNFVVGVGATREAPDLQVTVRIPTAVFSRK